MNKELIKEYLVATVIVVGFMAGVMKLCSLYLYG